jgi:hypothetical protein
MNWKGFGRKRAWPLPENILKFAWRNRGKPQKTSFKIDGVPAEV